jgi:hypothetical protein
MDYNMMIRTILLDKMMSRKNPTLYSIAAIAAYDIASKNAPSVAKFVTDYLKKKLDKRITENVSILTNPDKQYRARITIDRRYSNETQTRDPNNWSDAVINHILSLDTIKSLFYNGRVIIPDGNDEIEITDDISFHLVGMKMKEDELEGLKYELRSKTGISAIHAYIRSCQQNYSVQLQEEMGDFLYFFDHYTVPSGPLNMANRPPESNLIFEKNRFITNRCLDNVFFEDKPYLENRVNLFKNHKEWYDERGIPYTLGLMLHGDPGCGKTSTIKAIAKELDRHIVNIQLSHIQTNTQLKKLFYDEKLHIMERENDVHVKRKSLNVPIEKRLYVIEDIDAMGDLVHKRGDEDKPPSPSPVGADNLESFYENISIQQQKQKHQSYGNRNGGAGGGGGGSIGGIDGGGGYSEFEREKENLYIKRDPITLSALLNILDGTLEIPGRVLIITTNHPEKIDPALIRPGRIDMILEYKRANREIISQMYYSFFRKELSERDLNSIEEYKWSPAEINAILFRNFFNSDNAIRELRG